MGIMQKGRRMRPNRLKLCGHTKHNRERAASFMGKSITQDMAYRQSQMKYEVNCSISGGPAGMGVWSLRSAGPGVLTVTQTSIQRQR